MLWGPNFEWKGDPNKCMHIYKLKYLNWTPPQKVSDFTYRSWHRDFKGVFLWENNYFWHLQLLRYSVFSTCSFLRKRGAVKKPPCTYIAHQGCPSKMPIKDAPQRCPSKMPLKDAPQGCPSRMPLTDTLQRCSSKMLLKEAPQRCPSKKPLKDVPQWCPSMMPFKDAHPFQHR